MCESPYDDLRSLPIECDRNGAAAENSKTERAIWSGKATVDPVARSAFISEVAKFADKEAFAIRTSQPRGDGVHFLVQMFREDVKILVLNPFDDPAQFDCFFYPTGPQPVPDEVVDALARDFREELGSLLGVVFKE
jgi:hypothetical protein